MRFVIFLLSAFSFALLAASNAATNSDQLVQACTEGDLAKVQRLLDRGAKVNEPDGDGRLPLLSAMFSRKAEVVSLLLKRGADPNRVGYCPERGCTSHPALVFAAYLNDPKVVKLLLDAKADVAWKDHLATRKANVDQSVEVFKILRAAGGHEWQSPEDDAGEKQSSSDMGKPAPLGVSELLPARTPAIKPSGDKLRLAIIADDETQTAADVLTSDLSNQFQLVERNELDRVLNEQKLSHQFGADAAKAQQLGSVLGADAIAIVRKIELGGESLIELRFVRVSPGVILDTAYRAWPLENVATWAKDAAARLNTLSAKVRGQHAVALSPADFRPATNTPAAAILAREAALLVSDRLVRQPEVVVLERKAITALTTERSLSNSGEFWAGGYLVDGTAEAALDGKGPGTLTLRLQPMDGRPALVFTVRGATSQVGALVDELVSKATKALALQPARAADEATEAERYFAESRAAYQRSLFLSAYRAAETAALLGLRTPEFTEWRLKAALGLVVWQTKKVCVAGGFEAVRWAGWSEAWVNQRMGGEEWLRVPEWIELGRQSIELWHELLCAALESGDIQKAQAALEYQRDVVGACFGIWYSVNLSAVLVDNREQIDGLPRALRKTIEDALAITNRPDRQATLAPVQVRLAVLLARNAGALYPEIGEYTTVMKKMLARHFTTEDMEGRVGVRLATIAESNQTSNAVTVRFGGGFSSLATGYAPAPSAIPAQPALLAEIGNSKAPEDVLTSEILRFRRSKNPAERRVISDRVFNYIWEIRQIFVEDPRVLMLVESAAGTFGRDGANAPHFANQNREPDGGEVVLTPELRELRRNLFLLVARQANEPGPALHFYDDDFHPADEDAQELAVLHSKVIKSSMAHDENGFRRGVGTGSTAVKEAAAPPKRVLPKTPTYANHPPLRVTRSWIPEKAMRSFSLGFKIDPNSPAAEGDHVWIYGQTDSGLTDDENVRAYLLDITFPSLETQAWELPAIPRNNGGSSQEQAGASILVEPDRVFVGRKHTYFAVGNRRTRQWQVNRELQPSSAIVRVGADLYFLTESAGVRGMVRYSPETQKAELLASNRRVPQQTPLDDPSTQASSLSVTEAGVLEMTVDDVKVGTAGTPSGTFERKPSRRVTYNPVTKAWTGPEPLPPQTGRYNFVPLKAPQIPIAYWKSGKNVITLQLPSAEMPKARIPFEMAPSRESDKPDDLSKRIHFLRWYWTGKGYLMMDAMWQPTIWFLPQAELDAYLDSHEPEEDESSVAPPVPSRSSVR